ncbi:MAG: rod shape-determining protein MreD [Burkholderiaceae bacterium]|jgi:rod shape-determining protein MreD|nr:rod shape-determining protein MreD [Burkholderiaceae bacterium]
MNLLRPGQPLLQPAKPAFIWGSLFLALLLDLLPFGRVLWMPDFLAVVLVFWSIHQPRRVGLATAFIGGLCLDVQQASLLGQHALAYSALIYFAIMIHRRMLWFSLPWQTVQLFPLFLAAHLIVITLRLLGGAAFPGWPLLLAPVFEALLWPVVAVLLLLPQRRPSDADKSLL